MRPQSAASPSARTGPSVSIYLGGAEHGETFEFIVPKDLALHMANTIQRLASPAAKASPKAI